MTPHDPKRSRLCPHGSQMFNIYCLGNPERFRASVSGPPIGNHHFLFAYSDTFTGWLKCKLNFRIQSLGYTAVALRGVLCNSRAFLFKMKCAFYSIPLQRCIDRRLDKQFGNEFVVRRCLSTSLSYYDTCSGRRPLSTRRVINCAVNWCPKPWISAARRIPWRVGKNFDFHF